jgi:hypothetical protein
MSTLSVRSVEKQGRLTSIGLVKVTAPQAAKAPITNPTAVSFLLLGIDGEDWVELDMGRG